MKTTRLLLSDYIRSLEEPCTVTLKMSEINAILKRSMTLEKALFDIRELLNAQPDKDCLGIASDDEYQWPVLEEVIDSITKALYKRG